LDHSKENGEKILLIYFSHFFDNDLAIHVDYRDSFSSNNNTLLWKPSRMHYKFSLSFIEGVRKLYTGFYLDNPSQFESGLSYIGIIQPNMNQQQKDEVIELFTKYFGEGKNEAIRFSLSDLQKSFNEIFSFFIKKNIPLNPEFAVLGLALVTLYSELQKISHPLDVKGAFLKALGPVEKIYFWAFTILNLFERITQTLVFEDLCKDNIVINQNFLAR
jgi:hypothetical protein